MEDALYRSADRKDGSCKPLSAAESEQLRVNVVKPPAKSKLDPLSDEDYVAGKAEMDEEFQLVLEAEEEEERFLSPK